MSQEIVYTSAPRGLKPNSSGFCTVLSTNGMARNLSERLEALSGYRFHFPAHDANARLNPVDYSHLKITVGGEPFHVLSRICDAGLDHTRRSNKLAHHVAIKAREITPSEGGSPAWTLAEPGFCETRWEGEPRLVAEGRKRLPESQRSPQPAAVWKSLTGDAGWAGVLAESALHHPPRPMHVIFPAGTDTLSLVVEALHLLPAKIRWDVTFSTYFTRLQAGTECQWRFILDGTPEAAAIRRDPHKPKIDLCGDLGPAPDSDLVEFARTGRPPAPTAGDLPASAVPTMSEQAPGSVDEVPSASAHAAHADLRNLLDAEVATVAPPASTRPVRVRRKRSPGRLPLPWIIAGSLLLFLLITGGMIAAFVGGRGFKGATGQLAENELLANNGAPSAHEAAPKKVIVPDLTVLESAEKPAEPPPPNPEPVVVNQVASQEETVTVEEPVELEPNEPKPDPLPLADVINVHKEHLPLPSTKQNRALTGGGASAVTEAAQLAKIYVDDPEQVTLRIEGQDAILPPGVQFAITEELSPDRSMKTWEISETNPTGVAAIGTKIGRFRLHDNQLSFQWQQNLKSARLQFCRLIIEAEHDNGIQTANCSLFDPVEQDPIRLNFDKVKHFVELNLDPRSLPKNEYLKMEIVVRGIDESRLNMSGSILSPAASDNSDKKIDIDIASDSADQGERESLLRVEARLVEGNNAKPLQFHMRNQAAQLGVGISDDRPQKMRNALQRLPQPSDPNPQIRQMQQVRWKEAMEAAERIGDVNIDTQFAPDQFARSSIKNAHQELAKSKAKLDKFRRSIGTLLTNQLIQTQLTQTHLTVTSPPQWATQIVEVGEELQGKYDQAFDVIEAYERRLNQIEELYRELETDIEIHFRVYIEHDSIHADIPILRSRSAASAKSSGTRNADAPKASSPLEPKRNESSEQAVETPPSE